MCCAVMRCTSVQHALLLRGHSNTWTIVSVRLSQTSLTKGIPAYMFLMGTIVPIKNTLTAFGAILDSKLFGTAFVTSKVQSCNYHLRALLHLRPVLGHKLCLTVARVIGLSKLDYCNGLLTGISKGDLNRLQLVQNRLARIATNTPRRARISPVLASLHWLPVRQCIS